MPTISPALGENEATVGTTLSMFVASVLDLSDPVGFASLGSETATEFVAVNPAAFEPVIALGPTETVSVN